MLIQSTRLLADRLDERHRLNSGDIEPLPASDILAPDHIVPAHHVALRLGKPGPVAFIGSSRQLGLFASYQPSELILSLLAAVWAGHHVYTLLGPFIEKVALFHPAPRWSAANRLSASPCNPASGDPSGARVMHNHRGLPSPKRCHEQTEEEGIFEGQGCEGQRPCPCRHPAAGARPPRPQAEDRRQAKT